MPFSFHFLFLFPFSFSFSLSFSSSSYSFSFFLLFSSYPSSPPHRFIASPHPNFAPAGALPAGLLCLHSPCAVFRTPSLPARLLCLHSACPVCRTPPLAPLLLAPQDLAAAAPRISPISYTLAHQPRVASVCLHLHHVASPRSGSTIPLLTPLDRSTFAKLMYLQHHCLPNRSHCQHIRRPQLRCPHRICHFHSSELLFRSTPAPTNSCAAPKADRHQSIPSPHRAPPPPPPSSMPVPSSSTTTAIILQLPMYAVGNQCRGIIVALLL